MLHPQFSDPHIPLAQTLVEILCMQATINHLTKIYNYPYMSQYRGPGFDVLHIQVAINQLYMAM
jgi:hypothetical protein